MAIGNDFVERLQKARVLQKSITRSVNDLIKDFQSGKIVVPSYQRTFVWDSPKQCRFIESVFIDEADFVNGMLYHRCFSPSLTQTELQPRKRTTVNSPTKFYLNGLCEADNISEAIDIIIEFIVDRIKEDEYSISRLASLSFVGTHMELSDKSNRDIKKFKPLGIENSNSKKLYIDVSGGRTENVQNVTEIASLFSFMSEFKFVE